MNLHKCQYMCIYNTCTSWKSRPWSLNAEILKC